MRGLFRRLGPLRRAHLGSAFIVDSHRLGLAVLDRVEILARLISSLLYFWNDRMRVRKGIVADAGHLPGDFPARRASGNLEAIVRDFTCDIEIRSGCADRRQLVTEVAIKRFGIIGKRDWSAPQN